jgi:membrane protein YqaA with SNARE-associated domain
MDISSLLANPQAAAEFFRELVYGNPWGIIILFLFTIVANASIFFPIIVEPIVFVVAAFAPNLATALLVGIVTGTAAAIGEMSGYVLGLVGVNTLKKMKDAKVEKVFEIGEKLANRGMPIIFIFAFTPLPFDLVGIAAGIIKYDLRRFFLATLVGKALRYTLVALVGFLGMEAIPWLAQALGL